MKYRMLKENEVILGDDEIEQKRGVWLQEPAVVGIKTPKPWVGFVRRPIKAKKNSIGRLIPGKTTVNQHEQETLEKAWGPKKKKKPAPIEFKSALCAHPEQLRTGVGNDWFWWCKNCGAIAEKGDTEWTLPNMAKQNQKWVGP